MTAFPVELDDNPVLAQSPPGNHSFADHYVHHNAHYAQARANQEAIGKVGTTDETSLRARIGRIEQIARRVNVCRGVPELGIGSVLPIDDGREAVNAANLNSMIATALFFGSPTTFEVPPNPGNPVYPINGFVIGNAAAPIILEGHSQYSTVLSYRGSGAGGALARFAGTEVANWAIGPGGRITDSGLRKMTLANDSSQPDSIGLDLFACTHMVLDHMRFYRWRRNALRARNLADTSSRDVGMFFCGSLNGNGGTNYACVDYGSSGAGAGRWAVDRVQHEDWQIEDFGDRIFHFADDGNYYVNKLDFKALKCESSGAGKNYVMGGDTATGAPFYFQNTDGIIFQDLNATMRHLRTGQATLPAMMRMAGWCNVQILGGPGIDLGPADGGIKPFTRVFHADDPHTNLVEVAVEIGAESAAAWPTAVNLFSNSPRFGYSHCGFKGNPPAPTPPWVSGAYTPLLSG